MDVPLLKMKIVEMLIRLNKLEIRNCTSITCRGLFYIVTNLINLLYLDIGGNNNYTISDVIKARNLNQNLKIIYCYLHLLLS